MMRLAIVASLLTTGPALPSHRVTQQQLELDVLSELNLARARPQDYVRTLRRFRGGFDGNLVRLGDGDVEEDSVEGPSAVDEAIRFVQMQTPLPVLIWDDELAASAAEQAQDQAATGIVGHDSSSGASFERRIFRHVHGRSLVSEVISYGEVSNRDVVRQLIVDDGERDRGHRRDIYDSQAIRAGVACDAHPTYRISCVVDLSD